MASSFTPNIPFESTQHATVWSSPLPAFQQITPHLSLAKLSPRQALSIAVPSSSSSARVSNETMPTSTNHNFDQHLRESMESSDDEPATTNATEKRKRRAPHRFDDEVDDQRVEAERRRLQRYRQRKKDKDWKLTHTSERSRQIVTANEAYRANSETPAVRDVRLASVRLRRRIFRAGVTATAQQQQQQAVEDFTANARSGVPPTVAFMNQFESNADAAQAKFAFSSGFNSLGDAFLNPTNEGDDPPRLSDEDICRLRNIDPITDKFKLQQMRKFIKRTTAGQAILACASCGITNIVGESSDENAFNEDTLLFGGRKPVATVFEILQENLHQYQPDPLNQGSLFFKVRTCTIINNVYFHLHHELLINLSTETESESSNVFNMADTSGIKVPLCGSCYKQVRRGILPDFNVRYRDFGNLAVYQTLVFGAKGLNLTLAETKLCSKVITFQTLLKYTGSDSEFSKGHCISFGHDGVVVAEQALPRTDPSQVSKLISVAFVGSKESWQELQGTTERRAAFLEKQQHLKVRPAQVRQFLLFKKAIRDPNYANITIHDFDHKLTTALEAIPNIIFDQAILCDHKDEQELEKIVHDRTASADEVQAAAGTMEHVFVSGKIRQAPISGEAFLNIVQRQCFGGHVGPFIGTTIQDAVLSPGPSVSASSPDNIAGGTAAASSMSTIILSRTEPIISSTLQVPVQQVPVNEFGQNNDLYYGSFPDLFLLGEGLRKGPMSSLNQRELDHMLLHYDGRFAKRPQFLFLAFNQLQRHATAREVSCKVKGDENAMKTFQEIVNNPENNFQDRLQAAIDSPDSSDSKYLQQTLNSVMRTVGKSIPWSEEQRSYAMTMLMAMIYYAGPFTFFVTMAPSNTDSVLALRLSRSVRGHDTSNGTEFNCHDEDVNRNFPLPTLWQRGSCVAKNPVTMARVYRQLMEAFLEILVGMTPEYSRRKDAMLVESDDDSLPGFNGIFGTVTCYGFVSEEQAKGPEHAHGVLTTELSPLSLQRYIDDPTVMKRICRRFDGIIQSFLPAIEKCKANAAAISTHPAGFIGGSSTTPVKPSQSYRDQRYSALESHSLQTLSLSAAARMQHDSDEILPDELLEESCAHHDDGDMHQYSPTAMMCEGNLEDQARNPESEWCDSGINQSMLSSEHSEIRNDPHSVQYSLDASLTTEEDKSDMVALMTRAFAVAYSTNRHSHTFTCHKGESGKYRCRLAYPRATCNRTTGLLQLEQPENSKMPLARTRMAVKVTYGDPLLDLKDDRVVILELQRPTDNFDSQKQEEYDSIPEGAEYWAEYETGSNSNVVTFSPCLTAMIASNTCVEVLGNLAQSKSATYYIVKYMTKDGNKVQTPLPIVSAALRKMERYPSRAEDAGTDFRNTARLLNMILNSTQGGTEVGGQTAALGVLGFPSNIFSHPFAFVFIRPAIKYLSSQCVREDDGITTSDEAILQQHSALLGNTSCLLDVEIDLDDDAEAMADVDENDGLREIIAVGSSSSSEVLTFAQFEHYLYRCCETDPTLRDFTYYEWTGIITVIKKAAPTSQNTASTIQATVQNDIEEEQFEDLQAGPTNDDMTEETTRSANSVGRRKNGVFAFHSDHPMSTSHIQRLRSKHVIPMLAGRPPPRHPGPRREDDSWLQQANEFAAYYLTLHRPFSKDLGQQFPLTYAELLRYVTMLQHSDRYIDKARLHWIRIASQGLSVSAKELKMHTQFRGRATKYWGSENDENQLLQEELNPFRKQPDESTAAEALRQFIDSYDALVATDNQETLDTMRNIETSISRISVLDQDHSNSPDNITPSSSLSFDALARAKFQPTDPNDVIANKQMFKRIRAFKMSPESNATSASFENADSAMVTSQDSAVSAVDNVPQSLNPTQQDIFNQCIGWYEADDAHRENPNEFPLPEALLVVLTGAAGTGKTFLINQIIEKINKPGAFKCCAPTGIAATNLPNGYTVHTLYAYNNDGSSYYDVNSKEASVIFGKDARFIVIDEFSMMQARMLSHIDQRLQNWYGNSLPFGGLTVILMGDPFQLFPVGVSLISAACDSTSHDGRLFRMFRRINLTKQERSFDEPHSRRLEFLRDPTLSNPVRMSGIVDELQELTANDAISDPLWRQACIVVAGNEQRVQINLARAVSFAKETGQPVIAWRLPICQSIRRKLNARAAATGANISQSLQAIKELTFYFVAGAPAVISHNVSTTLRIANGTRCKLHSLTLGPANADQHWSSISQCYPGEVYWLPDDDLPISVNVELPNLDIGSWDPDKTIRSDAVVVPLTLMDNGDAKLGKTARLRKAKIKVRTYWVDLAFAVTFFKVQGRTEERIILDFNCAGSNQMDVNLPAFYVGVSRVRHSSHMRILPMSAATREHLLNLKFSKALVQWHMSTQ